MYVYGLLLLLPILFLVFGLWSLFSSRPLHALQTNTQAQRQTIIFYAKPIFCWSPLHCNGRGRAALPSALSNGTSEDWEHLATVKLNFWSFCRILQNFQYAKWHHVRQFRISAQVNMYPLKFLQLA